MRRLEEEGLGGKLYFLIGIAPLRTAKSASWMREHLFGTIISDEIVRRMESAADPESEGRKIAVELIAQLAAIPGVSGAHVMAPNNEKALPEVLAAALSLGRGAPTKPGSSGATMDFAGV
jgi:methylenetetrahydrofolate reductase (NADPH)